MGFVPGFGPRERRSALFMLAVRDARPGENKQVQCRHPRTQYRTRLHIERHMLFEGQSGIDNPRTPAGIEHAQHDGRAHLPEQAVQPHAGQHRKRYMQRGTGIPRGIHRFQKSNARIPRPIYIRPGDGRGPEKENRETLLQYLSPLGWEHINLTGDYLWRRSAKLKQGKYRSLRPFAGA